MARKAIEVNETELQKAINEVERSQPNGKFANRSLLWKAIEDSQWAKTRNPRPLTGQVAMIIAKKGNLKIATPVGLRGRQKGAGPVVRGERKKRTIPLEVLTKAVPKEFHKVVAKVAAGSMKAAIKLKCLDCTCFQPTEIRECAIKECSLWAFRPYKNKVQTEVTESGTDNP